jgi:hypothetical protein
VHFPIPVLKRQLKSAWIRARLSLERGRLDEGPVLLDCFLSAEQNDESSPSSDVEAEKTPRQYALGGLGRRGDAHSDS